MQRVDESQRRRHDVTAAIVVEVVGVLRRACLFVRPSVRPSVCVLDGVWHYVIWTSMCIPVSMVPNLSALRSAARCDLVVPRTRLQLGNRAFCVAGPVAWNVVSHWTFVRHLHCQLSKTCSKHLFSHVPILYWLTVSRVRAANILRRYCSDYSHVTASYRLSFYYYYYF